MKKIVSLLVMLCVGVFAVPESEAHPPLPSEERREVAKKLYGRIKVVKSRSDADFVVRVVQCRQDADVRVFVSEDSAWADNPGRWYYTKFENEWCHYKIFFTENPDWCDVNVFFVDYLGDAGLHFRCPPDESSSPS